MKGKPLDGFHAFIPKALVLISFVLPLLLHGKSNVFSGSLMPTGKLVEPRVPVYSSINGYVGFVLSADLVTAAKRKVGPFSLPKQGVVIHELKVEFKQAGISTSDWSRILEMIESLDNSELNGTCELTFLDAHYETDRLPVVRDGKLWVFLSAGRALLLVYSQAENLIIHDIQNLPQKT